MVDSIRWREVLVFVETELGRSWYNFKFIISIKINKIKILNSVLLHNLIGSFVLSRIVRFIAFTLVGLQLLQFA